MMTLVVLIVQEELDVWRRRNVFQFRRSNIDSGGVLSTQRRSVEEIVSHPSCGSVLNVKAKMSNEEEEKNNLFIPC